MTLEETVMELENKIEFSEHLNSGVSQKSVAWHIDHCLNVIKYICNTIKKSDPKVYKKHFNLLKTIILTTGYIPRGKAKAPKPVNTQTHISSETLKILLAEVKPLLLNFNGLDKNSHFKHPYFGLLNTKPSKRFLKVHTNHHLKIINDIIKK